MGMMDLLKEVFSNSLETKIQKQKELDELAMKHYATSFHNLEPPERGVILALYDQLYEEE